MDARDSPYAPGAGTRPPALVGRGEIVERFDATLERLERRRSATAPVITGPRGSGKTVLLNELVGRARERQWFTAVEEVTPQSSLPKLVAFMARDVLFEMNARKRFVDRVQRALGILKAFTAVKAFGIELTIDADAIPGRADTGDLARDLRDLFVELGTLAGDHDVGVLFALDEIHVLGERALDDLYFALHRTAQDSLPVAFISCGLFPSWQSGDETQAPSLQPSSYAARMFTPFYIRLGPLSDDEARRALADPAAEEGTAWEDDSLAAAVDFCEGNAWLIQMLGDAAWREATQSPIRGTDVMRACEATEQQLNEWFFPRLLRDLDDGERQVLAAMARVADRGPIQFSALMSVLDSTEPKGVVGTTVRLARRDLVRIEQGSGRWVNVETDAASFTVPRIGPYLRQNELL